MFGKKKCKNCGERIEDKWNFCPRCGNGIKNRNIFDDFDKEFQGLGKAFGIPKIDLKPGSDGVSIIISSGEIRPSIRREVRKEERPVKIAKSTEEPETKIERKGNRQTINIKLPGVKKEDIEIKRLENSIEIKAFTGDKAYFKLIPVPSNAAIIKSFENEMLKIEVMR
jgi:HSP20 family molecular chaperone IbpA